MTWHHLSIFCTSRGVLATYIRFVFVIVVDLTPATLATGENEENIFLCIFCNYCC